MNGNLSPWLGIAVVLVAAPWTSAQYHRETEPQRKSPMDGFYNPKEPVAKRLSLEKSAEFLDKMAVAWNKGGSESCVQCHTNFLYPMARPLLGETPGSRVAETRKDFEHWLEILVDSQKGEKLAVTKAQEVVPSIHRRDPDQVHATVVGMAVALASLDAGGKLQPRTREALDRALTYPLPGGLTQWNGCSEVMVPMEFTPDYKGLWLLLAAGMAPGDYLKTEAARKGLEGWRQFSRKHQPAILHNQVMLLWASLRVEGLMGPDDRAAAIEKLLSIQQKDGGWSLPSLTSGKTADSDGYATGFVVYVLRQAGVSPARNEIKRGLDWLKSNQRESGCWFTASPAAFDDRDRRVYYINAGTAFAVMALKACEDADHAATAASDKR